MLHQPNSERSVLVPVLSEELTTQTFVVPKEFADQLELHAFQMIEAIKVAHKAIKKQCKAQLELASKVGVLSKKRE